MLIPKKTLYDRQKEEFLTNQDLQAEIEKVKETTKVAPTKPKKKNGK
jgi:hypothetical protein